MSAGERDPGTEGRSPESARTDRRPHGEPSPDDPPSPARPAPPARWEALLLRVVPREDAEMLRRELAELYRSVAEREGESRARRRYRREVLAFARRTPGRAVRGALASGGEVLTGFTREVGRSARSLRRSPGFAAVAALTLALGIGANALIFAVVDRALLRPLPYPQPDRLVTVMEGWGTSLGSIRILQERMTTVEALGGAWDARGMTLESEDGGARRVTVAQVSPEYLHALGIAPTAGRLFRAEEAEPGNGRVALLSHDLWQASYGGGPEALEATLRLEGEGYRVVGVLPPGFDLPSPRNEIWIPAVADPANVGLLWGTGTYSVLARMTPGTTPQQVKEELLRVGEEVRLANPLWTPNPDFWDAARTTLLQEARARWARTPLLILLGAVGVVLLVVCANVANLLLSRGLSRQRDQAVRASLGAGAARLAAGELTEALLLAGVGTALGVALAAGGLEALRPHLPVEIPGAAQVTLDLRVLAGTGGIALLTALLSGAIPALRTAGRSPASLLRAGRGQSDGPARRRTTRTLVAAQMAAAVVLVAGAGLLARSLDLLNRVDPGFETEGRVTARLDLPPGLAGDPAARALYLDELRAALEADGALEGVSLASTLPFGAEWENMAAFIPGVTDDPNDLPMAHHHRVTPGFLAAAGIPLLSGRWIGEEDQLGAPLVAVVDRAFAETHFPGEDPVGRVLRYPWRGAPDLRIVGVVGAVSHGELADPPEPTVWVPLAQMGLGAPDHAVVLARAPRDLGAGLAAIQARARGFDPRIAVSELAPWDELLGASLAGTRLLTLLLLVFAGTTLVLGCIGVYGVVAFSVRERVREIGVRMTLGADPSRIRARVVREGLWLALPGGALGLLLAALAGRLLESVLYGVSALDPVTFTVTPLVLVGAAILAAWLPARRATRVDPATVLREG